MTWCGVVTDLKKKGLDTVDYNICLINSTTSLKGLFSLNLEKLICYTLIVSNFQAILGSVFFLMIQIFSITVCSQIFEVLTVNYEIELLNIYERLTPDRWKKSTWHLLVASFYFGWELLLTVRSNYEQERLRLPWLSKRELKKANSAQQFWSNRRRTFRLLA